MPEWYANDGGKQTDACRFFIGTFWRLSTCRQIGMGFGPIPWTATQTFADCNGFSPVLADRLHSIITAMDAVYLKWVSDEAERKRSK